MVTFLSFTLAVQSPLESGDENGIVNFSGFSNVSSLVPSIIYLPVVEHLFEAIFVIVIEGKLSIFVKSSFFGSSLSGTLALSGAPAILSLLKSVLLAFPSPSPHLTTAVLSV